MEQIVIQVKNKEKAEILLEMLKALDFVNEVNVNSGIETEAAPLDKAYPLQGKPIQYAHPFDPVAEADWGTLQ